MFLELLAQLAANSVANAIPLLGIRHCSELLFRDAFEALATRHAGFRFVPTVSGDEVGWDSRRGPVAAHIDEAMAGLNSPDAYFCGQREMVAQLPERLTAAGIADERQVYERY